MVNALIADDDLDFCKNLINDISDNNDIRICKVCTNGKEALDLLNNSKIDIVILGVSMLKYNGMEVLRKLSESKKEKYKDSIIVMSGDSCFMAEMIRNPLVYEYITKGTEKSKIVHKINRLIENKDIEYKKKRIINELERIGYDIGYKGTSYLSEAILQMYINRDYMMDNLQKDIYPIISKVYDTKIHNIKCNINNATEAMYYRCDAKKLKEYFNFYDDMKPTTKTVIYTVLNKII